MPDASIRAVLLDIEGTTTPIDFVHSTLFPFARREVTSFIARNGDDPAVRQDLEELRREHAREQAPAIEWSDMRAAAGVYAHHLIDADRKSPALKSLQGKIWQEGYERGELRGIVYTDVVPALRRWRAQGLRVAIYSSGSVLAQRLLFSTTAEGDLTTLIDTHFDTAVGPKLYAASYRRIAAQMGLEPSSILFISDNEKELAAADSAGLAVALAVRPGNAPVENGGRWRRINSFENV